MARKPLTPEKRVASEFRKWLREHPNMEAEQKLTAFNRIADQVLAENDRDKSTVTG